MQRVEGVGKTFENCVEKDEIDGKSVENSANITFIQHPANYRFHLLLRTNTFYISTDLLCDAN